MIKLIINNKEVSVPKNSTIMQACNAADVTIPRFCYHERLAVAGNCRMCLVEVEKAPKPVASCAMPALDGMVVHTDTPFVKKAREGVLEFLLANHPLDCPICDQGGECDLQDQTMIYGSDRSRQTDIKRAVEDKDCGPLIKTSMNRCIHCTRCVRFTKDIAGTQDLGVVGRGQEMEIGTYVKKAITSELSGNVIDLCPVGALTSKPYAFKARPWELKSVESVDVSDSLGSNIKIDAKGSDILRISPVVNEDINEEWISDKARFAFDGLKTQRLTTPLLNMGGQFKSITWEEGLSIAKKELTTINGRGLKAVVGPTVDTETLVALKDLVNKLGSSDITSSSLPYNSNADFRSNYILNKPLNNLAKADLCLLVGTNPRFEGSALNLKLKKAVDANNMVVATVGPAANLTYKTHHLGNNVNTLLKIAEGRHPFCQLLKEAKNPIILVGSSIFSRADSSSIINIVNNLETFVPDLVVNTLQGDASSVGSLDLGLVSSNTKTQVPAKVLYLVGADSISQELYTDSTFIIYQGHHGDKGAELANLILPGVPYTEKSSTYINAEGRSQETTKAYGVFADAREDWKILVALNAIIFDNNFAAIRGDILARMKELSPTLLGYNNLPNQINSSINSNSTLYKTPLFSTVDNFYMTDTVSKASKLMARCTSEIFNNTSHNYLN